MFSLVPRPSPPQILGAYKAIEPSTRNVVWQFKGHDAAKSGAEDGLGTRLLQVMVIILMDGMASTLGH